MNEEARTIRVDGCGDVTVTRHIRAGVVEESGEFVLKLHNPVGMGNEIDFGQVKPSRQASQINIVAASLANEHHGGIGGHPSRGEPNRGVPNRGTPNRGEPNRGR